jgi:hypothetical protein
MLTVGAGSSGARAGAFAWLRPSAAPPGWPHVETASSGATLFYPPGWQSIPGDTGTVTRTLLDRSGRYAGYLNVTPRQGSERMHGWAAFRTDHNREEGDGHVRVVAASSGLRFRGAQGTCVIDDYISRVGDNRYREIACLVSGHRGADVFIGAALRRDWRALGGQLERAASSFVQR